MNSSPIRQSFSASFQSGSHLPRIRLPREKTIINPIPLALPKKEVKTKTFAAMAGREDIIGELDLFRISAKSSGKNSTSYSVKKLKEIAGKLGLKKNLRKAQLVKSILEEINRA